MLWKENPCCYFQIFVFVYFVKSWLSQVVILLFEISDHEYDETKRVFVSLVVNSSSRIFHCLCPLFSKQNRKIVIEFELSLKFKKSGLSGFYISCYRNVPSLSIGAHKLYTKFKLKKKLIWHLFLTYIAKSYGYMNLFFFFISPLISTKFENSNGQKFVGTSWVQVTTIPFDFENFIPEWSKWKLKVIACFVSLRAKEFKRGNLKKEILKRKTA